jgi:glycosyltransferase involved in cell wall biosynthesis
MLELALFALALRREGCRDFFVRISPGAALVLNLLAPVAGFRVYYWMSGQARNLWPPWRQMRRRLTFAVGDRIARINARLAYRLVTGPEEMLSYYSREFGVRREKMALLYNDVPAVLSSMSRCDARKRIGMDPLLPIVLFVGRVSPLKGGGHVLPLFEALRRRLPEVRLLVVGDTSAMPDVPRQAREEGLDNVVFLGAIPNRDLAPYYRAADVFVLPSESEGFPRVLLEAMQHGLAPVAFDVGGVKDVLDRSQHEFVVARRDVEAMADCVSRLLADERLRAEQGRIGLERVKRYSTENVARMFVAAIDGAECASR